MKNVHILATLRASRFFKDDLGYYFSFETLQRSNFINQHMYITFDEEAKDGDWCIVGNGVSKLNTQFTSKEEINTIWKKIILLTTDQNLIADGVQAIDDEFLEWFVKNPSCEKVELGLEHYFDKNIDKSPFFPLRYKIIIPQEEPKTNLERLPFPELVEEFAEYYKKVPLIEEPKQETLEEASDRIRKELIHAPIGIIPNFNDGFEQGVKWQQEQDKSTDGEWLSPVPTERAWQEEKLVEIFGHYPNASPKWQYMNGLIQNSLDTKQMYSEEQVKQAITNFYMNDMLLTPANLTKVINDVKQEQ